jgi:hypothetical protein
MTLPTLLLTATIALAPGSAHAAALGGQPELAKVDAHHATLTFAADKLPRRADGRYDATITFAGGQRVGTLTYTGKRHGTDPIYRARVTSKSNWRVDTKYTARFVLAGGKPQRLLLKLRP